jgi:hypothetical protein
VLRVVLVTLLTNLCAVGAQPSAAELAREIRNAGLDPGECYRVRDLNYAKQDLRLYFNDGYLLFSKPVAGRRLWAVFSGENEGGDGEIIVLPPHRSERRSLASFVHSPNLDEHFRMTVLVASDSTTSDLLERARQIGKQSGERGILLSEKYAETGKLLGESFTMRLVQDLLNGESPSAGLFFGAIGSTRVGNFDIMHDPSSRDQILVGQVNSSAPKPSFETWCAFESRAVRQAGWHADPPLRATEYKIDATLDANLRMTADTRLKLRVNRQPIRALPFLISSRMRVTEAKLDGKPVEIFAQNSFRETAIHGGYDGSFLLVPSEPIAAGSEHELEVHHEGDVIDPAGNGVFFVGSRGTWYPHQFFELSKYEMTFRYPKALNLVGTGSIVEDKEDGDVRVTRCVADVPIRFAGFNLGEYRTVTLKKSGYTIRVCGNRSVEPALARKRSLEIVPQLGRHPRPSGEALELSQEITPTTPDNSARLNELSSQIEGAVEFMAGEFGPIPLKTITVSPIPGFFGQGFPGLVYLSTYAYLNPKDHTVTTKDPAVQTFFFDLLPAHELAHQWWGNLVTSESYQDDWLMESLANYSALMYLEKRKGTKAMEQVLDQYRSHLLAKRPDGTTVESSGPVTWGGRLLAAYGDDVWRVIIYEKGSWIIHMLRRYMGDDRFARLLAELPKRYSGSVVTTEGFRHTAAEFLPSKGTDPYLENFFESWVYGTGIPALKLDYSVRGKAPTLRVNGTVRQSGVDEEFSPDIPIEVQSGKGAAEVVKWVRTGDSPAGFTLAVKQPGVKLNVPLQSVLAVRR